MKRKEVIQNILKMLEEFPDKAPHLPWGIKNCPMCKSDACKWISKCRGHDRYIDPPFCKIVFFSNDQWNIDELRKYLNEEIAKIEKEEKHT